MAAALPVSKLAGLFVKTLSKPLSKRIKTDLGRYDATKSLLIHIGRASHTVTSYMTIWASGYRVRKIKPIEGEKALKAGAEFVGEGFVLAVSAAVVVFEYKRSAESTARKNEEKRGRIKATQEKLQAKLITLDIRLKAVEDLIKEQQQLEENKTLLTRVVTVAGTEKPKYIEPPKEKLVPIEDENDQDGPFTAVAKDDMNGSNLVESSTVSSISSENKKQQSSSWWKFW